MKKKRFVILDDHPAVRFALRVALEKDNHKVVGEGGSLAEGRSLLKKLRCDVLLVDVTFQDGECDLLIQEWRKKKPESKIIVFSMHCLGCVIRRMMAAGANAYFNKLDDLSLLPGAITEVISGGVYYSPTAVKLLKQVEAEETQLPHLAALLRLSSTERMILTCLGQGYSRKEIAKDYGISIDTVETYLRRASEKLGLKNRRGLIRYAIRNREFTAPLTISEFPTYPPVKTDPLK